MTCITTVNRLPPNLSDHQWYSTFVGGNYPPTKADPRCLWHGFTFDELCITGFKSLDLQLGYIEYLYSINNILTINTAYIVIGIREYREFQVRVGAPR